MNNAKCLIKDSNDRLKSISYDRAEAFFFFLKVTLKYVSLKNFLTKIQWEKALREKKIHIYY